MSCFWSPASSGALPFLARSASSRWSPIASTESYFQVLPGVQLVETGEGGDDAEELHPVGGGVASTEGGPEWGFSLLVDADGIGPWLRVLQA